MILGVVPARGGSKGMPRKNLVRLGGQPLIVHTLRAARASARLGAVVVSTDDAEIADAARREGIDVPRLRPAALSTDEIAVWPAVRDAVQAWEQSHRRVDTVVVLQPTSPLRTAADIDGCIGAFETSGADLCASVVRPHDSPYFNMVERRGQTPFVRPCSETMRGLARRQDAPPVYALNGAVYVVGRAVLEQLENQFTVDRYAVYEMPASRSVDIDSEHDLALAEWWALRAPLNS